MYQYHGNRTLGMNPGFANYAGAQMMNTSRYQPAGYAPQMIMSVPFHPSFSSNPVQQCYGNQMAFMNQFVPQNINPQVMYWNPTLLNNNNLQLQLQHIGLRTAQANRNRNNPHMQRRARNRNIANKNGKYPVPNVEPASGPVQQPEKTPSSLLPLSLESLKLSQKNSDLSKIETTMPSRFTVRSDLTDNSSQRSTHEPPVKPVRAPIKTEHQQMSSTMCTKSKTNNITDVSINQSPIRTSYIIQAGNQSVVMDVAENGTGVGSKVTVRPTPNWAEEMQREDEVRSCADLNTQEDQKRKQFNENEDAQWETEEELHVLKPVRARDANGRNFPTPPRVNRFGNLNTMEAADPMLNGTRISIRNRSISSQHKKVSMNSSISKPLRSNPGGMTLRRKRGKLHGYRIKDSVQKVKNDLKSIEFETEQMTQETEKANSNSTIPTNDTTSGNEPKTVTTESKKSRKSLGRKLSSLFKSKSSSSNHSKSSKNSSDNSKNST